MAAKGAEWELICFCEEPRVADERVNLSGYFAGQTAADLSLARYPHLPNSVSLAIEVELDDRGLRAPYKFKSAVSGCTCECAAAQSQDFGIIATERGWNLYVCGNGGMKPQHAQLLAADLGKEISICF